jgi:hypothetical protein
MFGAAIIESRGVKLISTLSSSIIDFASIIIDSSLKLKFVVFESKHNFYTKIYCSIQT